ncbi:MAG: hypothetical protein M3Q29_25790 [Chloroflexota bacterium]|nr:hypothetical protein [Chloroflexota bacterium]
MAPSWTERPRVPPPWKRSWDAGYPEERGYWFWVIPDDRLPGEKGSIRVRYYNNGGHKGQAFTASYERMVIRSRIDGAVTFMEWSNFEDTTRKDDDEKQ